MRTKINLSYLKNVLKRTLQRKTKCPLYEIIKIIITASFKFVAASGQGHH